MKGFFSIFLLCSLLAAQQQAPVIKVTTRLVQVSVVVHDKSGAPVGDLKMEDFVLTDNGAEQTIRFFSKEVGEPAAVSAKHAPLPAGLVSNRYENNAVTALPNSVTAILIDALNTQVLDQQQAKEALIKFLGQLKPGDRVAIYTLRNGLKVLHDFTADSASLLRALNLHKNQSSFSEAASSFADASAQIQDLGDLFSPADEQMASFYQAHRAEVTLKALATIANHLAGLPGRKNLIWLSGGLPLFWDQNNPGKTGPDFGDFSVEMKRTVQVLNDVGVAIYPVDAHGVAGAFDYLPGMDIANNVAQSVPAKNGGRMAAGGPGVTPPPRPITDPRPMDTRAQNNMVLTHNTMQEIADRTGGRAFFNSNDIARSIERAVDDTRVSYVLGYTPSHDEWNGKFREIKLKVNRPNVEARYRKGYYAAPNDDPKLRPALLVSAALSPMVSTGLELVARLMIAPTAEIHHAQVKVLLDAHELAFSENADGGWEANLDMLAVVADAGGEILTQNARTFNLQLKGPTYAEALKNGVLISADMDAPNGAAKARIVVRDAASGTLGSVDVPLIK